MGDFHFTYNNLKRQYEAALAAGYEIITCRDYLDYKGENRTNKIIVNRIDIDFSVKKALMLGEIYNELNIKGTFFVRLHAPEYNPFSFDNYKTLKYLVSSGHEIGYHSEIVDQAAIWDEDAADCLKRDVDILNRMLNIKMTGVASHGGMTGLNNLDFWKGKKPSDFGLLYEAYDREAAFDLFNTSFYISDSEWTKWKCYDKGVLMEDDRRSFEDHLSDDHQVIYLLIHSDTYFKSHFYENEN